MGGNQVSRTEVRLVLLYVRLEGVSVTGNHNNHKHYHIDVVTYH